MSFASPPRRQKARYATGPGCRSYFFARKPCALGFLPESRCREIAARNSVMDGVPNAYGRFRDSGKPVTGFSTLHLSTRLIAPCFSVIRDTESRRLHVARILPAPLTSDGHRLARIISRLILAGGCLR
jgi:hypothetical protein